MQPSDHHLRAAAAALVAAGLAACAMAMLSEQLGLGGEAGRGAFGWRRASLLAVGLAAFLIGVLIAARPRLARRLVQWRNERPIDRNLRILGSLVALGGIAACGLAFFAQELSLGAEAARGAFGWKRAGLLIAGGAAFGAGVAVMARPRVVPSGRDYWARTGRRLARTGRRLARTGRHLGTRSRRILSGSFGSRGRLLIDTAGLLLVLGIYAVVQFTYRKPPALEGGDQLDYFNAADSFPDVTDSHRDLRLGLLFPVRGFIEVFGYSEAAYYAVPFVAGLALAGFTYALGRMLFGWAVGVAAALLATLNPYVLWDSSHLLPDIPGTAAVVGAIVALVGAGTLQRRGRVDLWSVVLLVGGGFLLGWSYLTREFLLVMFPLVLVVFLAYRIPWRRLGWVVLGVAPPLLLEAAWGTFKFGDPLIRWAVTATPVVPVGEEVGRGSSDVFAQFFDHLWMRSGGWVFVALFAGVVLYGSFAAIRGDRRFLPIVAWVGGLWLALVLSSILPKLLFGRPHGFLHLENVRYWIPIMPGLVIGGLAVVRELIRIVARIDGLARPLTLTSLAAITVVTLNVGISSISDSSGFVRNGAASGYLQFREFLREEGSSYSSLYVDHGTNQSLSRVLPMYTRSTFGSTIWHGEIRALGVDDDFLSVDQIEGDLVVFQPRSIFWLVINRDGFRPPSYIREAPSSWQPVLISEKVVAYSVTRKLPRIRLHTVSARDWQILGSPSPADMMIENGRAVIEVPSDVAVYIFDGRGEHSGPPEVSHEAPVGSGGRIWGEIQMVREGDGGVTIRCYFYGDGARVVTSAAESGRYYTCRAPETGGPFDVRVAIYARGSVRLTLGDNTVEVSKHH